MQRQGGMTEEAISQRKNRLRVLACSVMLAATMSLAGCGGDDEMLASPGRQWFAEMLTMSSVADDMVEVQRLIIVDRKNSLKWSGELPFPPGTEWHWRWVSGNELEVRAIGYPTMRWRCDISCELQH